MMVDPDTATAGAVTIGTPRYPEHEKLKAVRDRSQAVGEFLEWLFGQGYAICRWRAAGDNGQPPYVPVEDEEEYERLYEEFFENGWWDDPDFRRLRRERLKPNPAFASWGEGWLAEPARIEDWLARFFGIDPERLEAEKREILAELRKAGEAKQEGEGE